jgi:NADPH2:quinone reductase
LYHVDKLLQWYSTMKVIQVVEPGGPETLQLQEVPVPEITSGTGVLVRLKAAGINPIDAKIREQPQRFGLSLPTVLGFDGAGVVDKVGENVVKFKPGDEVYFCHSRFDGGCGTYGEYTVAEQHFLAFKPNTLDFPEAAAIPLALITAWEALFDRARLGNGQTVLIEGGAGGVGHLAVQLAKQAGAHVLTTVGSTESAALAQRLGADGTIFYKDVENAKAQLELSPEDGVDVVLDTVGGKTTESSFSALRYGGDLVTLLQPDQDINWSVARKRNLRISLELMLTPVLLGMTGPQIAQTRILETSARRFDEGELQVLVAGRYPLKDAAEAHRKLEAGGFGGKLVLVMD